MVTTDRQDPPDHVTVATSPACVTGVMVLKMPITTEKSVFQVALHVWATRTNVEESNVYSQL